ncbi:MAG: transporter related protein [Lacrimispora sp.]|jgi:NitT/TauT family transport system ATP-binding protein|nr:transporter related protein [Lacrimispora sp.]
MELVISQLSKSFDGRFVLDDVNLHLVSGNIYCLMGPSGSGKTTLFHILLGLVYADSGEINGLDKERISAVFQENRLCEAFTPVDNVTMVMPKSLENHKSKAREALKRLLPDESLDRPVSTLSGGMKRRVAIIRALLVPFDMVIMDEPFTGLDEGTKQQTISYIKEQSAGKLVLISTHQEEDVQLLNGIKIHL